MAPVMAEPCHSEKARLMDVKRAYLTAHQMAVMMCLAGLMAGYLAGCLVQDLVLMDGSRARYWADCLAGTMVGSSYLYQSKAVM